MSLVSHAQQGTDAAAHIDVITASAGAGKTYTLARRLEEAIVSGAARPEAVVAITYTTKAAAELSRRLRQRLIAAGHADAAARVRDGYVGTVHSVCQRLIADLAFEAGSSPYPTPAPQSHSDQLFREVTGVATEDTLAELGPLVERLGLQADEGRNKRAYGAKSWRGILHKMIQQSRENRLDAVTLGRSAEASIANLERLLDSPEAFEAERDRALRAAVDHCASWVDDAIADDLAKKGKTAKNRVELQDWIRGVKRDFDLEGGHVPSWSRLCKALGSWTTRPFTPGLEPLRSALEQHLSHPRLHCELKQVVRTLFRVAADVDTAFVARKQAERLLDFGDMLAQAAEVLQKPAARDQLAGRLDLLMVDEFQDTSPVQLEVVLALASLARNTVWVGDSKQAIYSFQGSDPELMAAATSAALGQRAPEVLGSSYRSRPGLVDFCSELFAAALAPADVPREQVVLAPVCPEPPTLAETPSLHLWASTKDPAAAKGTRPKEADGIARHVRALLAGAAPKDAAGGGGDHPLLVREHAGDPTAVAPTRSVRPGDIAILARTNKKCRAIAAALEAAGVPARVAQNGLGQTPEALLLRAGLAVLADGGDTLAAAEIAWFTSSVADPDAWLAARIAAVNQAAIHDKYNVAFPEVPALVALRQQAEQAAVWAPDEAVLAVFDALDLPEHVLGWPDPQRHLANLEALRAVTADYQSVCQARRGAATIAGLVRHLEALPNDTWQALPAIEDAVRVLTYHKAKGLEWPVVVCASLNTVSSDDLFDVRVAPAPHFDPNTPLQGRELRWLPNPYGKLTKGIVLKDRAVSSREGQALTERGQREHVRLLYVGFTRARDHLVLSAVRSGKSSTAWLDRLRDADGAPLLALPWDEPGLQEVQVAERSWPCRVQTQVAAKWASNTVDATAGDAGAGGRARQRWFVRPDLGAGPDMAARVAQAIRPSAQVLSDGEVVTQGEMVTLGPRLPLRVAAEGMAGLGDAAHGFFAADVYGGVAEPEAVAAELLDTYGVAGAVEPVALVKASTRFRRWMDGRELAVRLPEWPVRWVREDGRMLAGDVDLLLDRGDGWVLVDHKSYPGAVDASGAKMRAWAGQLRAYGDAVAAATGRPVVEAWVHLWVRGEILGID